MALDRVTQLSFVNAYLVEDDDGLTVVDTGLSLAKRIVARAQELGAPIRRIVLTHAHGDHVGGLDALVALVPEDVEVIISGRDARWLAGDEAPQPGEPADAKARGAAKTKTQPTRTVEPGDRIGSLEVVAAPGHTPGQIALLDPRDRTLIAADAYSTYGRVATSAKVALRSPLPALASWHRPTALRSARELRALDPVRLAVGHGPVVENPGAAMDAAIASAS